MLRLLAWMLLMPFVFTAVTIWTAIEYIIGVYEMPFVIWDAVNGEIDDSTES